MCQCLGGRDVKKRQINQRKWWRKSKQQENMDANLFIPNVCLTVWMWRTTFTVNSKWKENKRVTNIPDWDELDRLNLLQPSTRHFLFVKCCLYSFLSNVLHLRDLLTAELEQGPPYTNMNVTVWTSCSMWLMSAVLNLSVGFWGLSESLAW